MFQFVVEILELLSVPFILVGFGRLVVLHNSILEALEKMKNMVFYQQRATTLVFPK